MLSCMAVMMYVFVCDVVSNMINNIAIGWDKAGGSVSCPAQSFNSSGPDDALLLGRDAFQMYEHDGCMRACAP